MNKKLVASLFLYEKEAIASFDNLTVISKDPVTLAKSHQLALITNPENTTAWTQHNFSFLNKKEISQ